MKKTILSIQTLAILACLALPNLSLAQFNSSIQGTITDASGGAIAKAEVKMQNLLTGVRQEIVVNDSGFYRFLSLPPGSYEVTASGNGFQLKSITAMVSNGQNRQIDFTLSIQTAATSLQVNEAAPLLDAAETREQMTITQATLRELPLSNNSYFGVLGLTPGVTGANNPADNFQTEYQSRISANGRSAYGNSFALDGMSTNSNITNGTTNLVMNPEAIQEITVETNVYKAEQSLGSSLFVSVTSKSGTNNFHGALNYFFSNEKLLARTSVPFVAGYSPFSKNNLNGAFGGPIIKNKTFFFASIEELRSKAASVSVSNFESKEFVDWATQRYPNSVGVKLLKQYPITDTGQSRVARTAAQDFGAANCGPASSSGIPCNLPVLLQGTAIRSPFTNGRQYNIRGDQYFGKNDRFYGNFINSSREIQELGNRSSLDYSRRFDTQGLQGNWTHTFSPSLLNEASFGGTYILGGRLNGGLLYVPVITVTNAGGLGRSANNTFNQKNNTIRDVVTWVKGNHSLKLGGTFFWARNLNLNPFVNNRPSFTYQNWLNFVQDNIFSGSYGVYDPFTGNPKLFEIGAQVNTVGAFFQDEWKVNARLHLTLSLRWDDFGNPSSRNNAGRIAFTNLALAPGKSVDEQFANAAVKVVENPYSHRLNRNISPRVGVAWSPSSNNKTAIRGGIGLFKDAVTLGEAVDRIGNNPPNYVQQTFGQNLAIRPPAAPLVGTSNDYNDLFGFQFPALPLRSLDSRGGIVGLNSAVGGLDPNLRAPSVLIYSAGFDHQLPGGIVAGATFNGSHTWDGLGRTDYNRFPGGLGANNVLTRLNPSFGAMEYISNLNVIDYNGLVVRGRKELGRAGTVQASYTLGQSIDLFAGGARSVSYDTAVDPRTITSRRADSSYDIRHRFSASFIYRLPSPGKRLPLLDRLAGGWQLSSVAIAQTGAPYTIFNGNNAIAPVLPGDYNRDGVNYDFPDIPQDLPRSFDRSRFLGDNGTKPVFVASQFTAPPRGREGNSPRNGFRNPGLVTLNASLSKNNRLWENWNLQLRFEFFNVLNRVNLGAINSNIGAADFGLVNSQGEPRSMQVGARLSF